MNVLIIGDLHAPFIRKGYLEHCISVKKRFNCDKIVFIGDLIDGHGINYFEHDPDGYSSGTEYDEALKSLKDWYKYFPKACLCLGNHDLLPFRKAFTIGLPKRWMRDIRDIFNIPKEWEIGFHHIIDNVFYTHGTNLSGDNAAMKVANQNRQSSVIGHLHSVSNIKYSASYKDIIFAVTVGCGIDYKSYAFNYGKDLVAKPIISCAVVLNGKIPILIPQDIGNKS